MSKFTEKQLAVISHDYGNMVVSASAGSGKTSVMIERLIRLIVEGKAEVKQILAVTFTRMAAQEMRERLEKAIVAKLKEGKNTEMLKKQLGDLPSASISTIDSFLNSLIKKYFYLVGVDPSFTIIAEAEESAVKSFALKEVFENLYETDDPDVKKLLSVFIKKRKDDVLKKTILSVYDFAESETDDEEYYRKALYNYTENGLKTIDNRLIARFIQSLNRLLPQIISLDCQAKADNLPAVTNYLASVAEIIENAKRLRTIESLKEVSAFSLTRPKLRKTLLIYDDFAQFFADFKTIQNEIAEFFYADFDDRLSDLNTPREILESIIRIVKAFKEEYSAQKKDINALDYSDLSHIGYKLLNNEEVLNDVKETYKFIFVDEYQDTNGIQESIFKLLENENLFVVGDVKQSIYGFRGCVSDNFAARIKNAATEKSHVELDSNFRSAKAVVETVNNVFSFAMTQSTMGEDYSLHPMIYGNLYGEYRGASELFYCNYKSEKPLLDIGVYSVEKHLEAEKNEKINYEKLIVHAVKKALEQEITVFDENKKPVKRLAGYGDIAVLSRTVKTGVDRIVKELEAAGIPTVSENERSIESYPEIQLIINILKCVLAPDEDIPLATALLSPVGGLTDADLKTVKEASFNVDFNQAVLNYRLKGDEIAKKIDDFYSYLGRIRLFSTFEGVSDLLRRIVREKSLDVYFSGRPGGEYKLDRINAFIAAGETNGKRFLEDFMENLDDAIADMTVPSTGGVNAVSVMSMHASKGLEFPVVIVTGVNRDWNSMDQREEVSLSRSAGIGVKIYDENTKKARNSAVKDYVSLIKRDDNLKEELRLLYVALSRAKCLLYVVSKTKPDDDYNKDIFRAKRQIDLFLERHIKCTEIPVSELVSETEKEERRSFILQPHDEALKEKIAEYVNFVYPYEKDTTLSLKRTVTEIVTSPINADAEENTYMPIFSSSDALTGTAYHKFLELIDFDKIDDNGLIDRLFDEKFTAEERSLIDVSQIRRILGLKIFSEIKGYKTYKEQPFIVSLPPLFAGESGTEDLLLQGVIDLLCVKDDEAIIIDYKHSGKSLTKLKETYSKQLDLYAYAVEKALGKKVVKKVLVNVKSAEETEV